MKKLLISAAVGTALLGTTPAAAQVASIATANPVIAIARSKAYQAANQQIETTYKAQIDQVEQKMQQRQSVLKLLDKNHDGQVDDAELKAAKAAKSPALRQLDQIENEVSDLQKPAVTAQLFALQEILLRYSAAQTAAINARHVGMLLRPDAIMYGSPTADITDAITAELDRSVPSVSVSPTANWQPSETTVHLQEQINQLQQLAAAQRANAPTAAAAPAPAAAAPATQPQAQPQGR